MPSKTTRTPPTRISIRVTKKDRLAAGDYWSCRNCLISTAVKRQLKVRIALTSAGSMLYRTEGEVTIGGVTYAYPRKLESTIRLSAESEADEFVSFSVPLTKCSL